ncbi:MAG: A-factor biosynthesis repeat-containing protein [Candidatus Saganbacteria bacterium]|uniref:A-factor biosynthesis repeat-containing protein n=1 Tax=Candidatus Saganbacteria bacterium TaxID=2575572 RepID=A0A833L0G9_UNCSA|nr:MAG: A-factor biosynthesis repeat-containing protein [Candidatus Saganbacteria bacterium]
MPTITQSSDEVQSISGHQISEYSPQEYPINDKKIDNEIVHKNNAKNVVIANPIILSREKNIFRTKIVFDLSHEFFFDHSLQHLPGLLLIEAARQFGTAISHQFFDVPFDSQFILHDLNKALN